MVKPQFHSKYKSHMSHPLYEWYKWVRGIMHAAKLVKGLGGINALVRPLNDCFYPTRVRQWCL